jgi:DNA-binding SARP family transcriptional activator/tetratricopeptide (TPR) repeat protein
VSHYHLRAAISYIDRKCFALAIEHFIASGNTDLVVDLVTRKGFRLTALEAVEQLRLWFKLLPQAVVDDNGQLLYIKSFLFVHNRDDEALPLLTRALAKFREQGDVLMQVKTLSPMSHIYAVLNDVRSLARCLDQLPPGLRDTDDLNLKKIVLALDLFQALWEEKFKRADRLRQRIQRLVLDADWEWMTLTYSCILRYLQGDLDEAEGFITESLQMELLQKVEIFRVFSLAFYATLLTLKDDRRKLQPVQAELTALSEKHGYLYTLGLSRRLAAVQRYSNHDLDSALDLIDASTEYFEQMGNIALPYINRLNRCLWLTRRQDPELLLKEARDAYKSLAANRTGQCLREIGLSMLGAVAREAGEHELAEQCLLTAIASSRAKGARQILCGSLLHLAKLYWDTGDGVRGRETLAQAMELAADHGYVTFWDLHLPTLADTAVQCIREQIYPDQALELIARYYGRETAEDLASGAAGAGEARFREVSAALQAGWDRGVQAPAASVATRVEAHLLGQFTISINGTPIPETGWRTRKSAGILKYLLLHSNHTVTRDQLMELFWPDSDQEAASLSLRVALYELRKVLARYGAPAVGSPALICDRRSSLEIRTGNKISVDVAEFISLSNKWRHTMPSLRETASSPAARSARTVAAGLTRTALLEQMISLYNGDLLEGDEYFDWVLPAREEILSRFIEAAIALAAVYMQQEEHDLTEQLLQRALDTDRFNEEICLRLLALYTATNQRGRAIKLYATFTRRLQEELGLQPDPRLTVAVSGPRL